MTIADLRANNLSEGLGIYAIGFLDGAVAIFSRANASRGLVDCAIYPGAYCLRHGVELFVKQMTVYVAYETHDPDLLYEPGHSLEKVWSTVVESVDWYADQHCGEDLRHHVDVINGMIAELEELDARGTLFRYPEFVQPAKKNQPRAREGTPVPFERVNLDDWSAMAEATLAAAQSLLSEWDRRTAYFRNHRGDVVGPLSDLVRRRPS
jgi:hypothetical protein